MITIVLSFACGKQFSLASGWADQMYSGITETADEGDSTELSGKVENVAMQIIGIAKIVALAIAMIMLLVIAMKYMAASPGEKADFKKNMVVYVVGAVILFALSAILQIIQELASVLNGTGDGGES